MGIFDKSTVKNKIELVVGTAADWPSSYQRLDLFIKVLRVLCPNLTDASHEDITLGSDMSCLTSSSFSFLDDCYSTKICSYSCPTNEASDSYTRARIGQPTIGM